MIEERYGNAPEAIKTVIVIGRKYYNERTFIGTNFVIPLKRLGVTTFGKEFQTVAAYENTNGKKPTKTQLKPHVTELLEHCDLQGIERIVCVSASYFAYLTGKKFEASIGLKFNCVVPGFEHIEVLPLLSPLVVNNQPGKRKVMEKGLKALSEVLQGTYTNEVFEFDDYELITDPQRAKIKLDMLMDLERVAWDIETTGLHHMKESFITHGFAIDKKNAFTIVVHEKHLGVENAKLMHDIVGNFLKTYKGKLLVHNVGFEGKYLAKQYWMKDYNDQQGIVDCFAHTNWDDSMLLNYALLNSTERTPLGLKDLAFEAYGDWDVELDIKNAINEPIEKLAYYNAVDVSATWYVWEKARSRVSDSQFEFYDVTMRKTQNLFLKLMLTGIPIDMPNVLEAKKELSTALEEASVRFYRNPYVLQAEEELRLAAVEKYNSTHKVARRTVEDFSDLQLNFNSSLQLRVLLYDIMEYEPIEMTATGAPKTNRDSLVEFMELERDEERKEVLDELVAFSQIAIILNTFLKSFENDSIEVAPGEFRLYGNYKNGGTQTFRPTANNPNLLNAPSGSKYGKHIKRCFKARPGFIIGSSDHASLQGRTGANLTKDANLIRLYNEDIDMHSFHATKFWPDEFPDFVDTKEYYESVKHDYPVIRNKSKPGTFLMQFGGGAAKLASTLKVPREEADAIFHAYHNELYPGMSKYNDGVATVATRQGYVDLGLGLRLQCPNVYAKDDGIKAAALRSVANATVQFWDVLTLIGIEKFQAHIEEQGYVGRVIMHSTIYDSVYMEIEANPLVIQWVNNTLIPDMVEDYMENQDVKLMANLDITKEQGTWADLTELPNGCDIKTIQEILND